MRWVSEVPAVLPDATRACCWTDADSSTATLTLTGLRRPALASCSTASVCVAENRPAAQDEAMTRCGLRDTAVLLDWHKRPERHIANERAAGRNSA